MVKNKNIVEKISSPIKKIEWRKVGGISLVVLAFALYFGGFAWVIAGNPGPDPEQIEQIKVGMTKAEVFTHLEDKGWSEYDDKGYHYAWNFKSPNGSKKTFWVTINYSDVVTDIATY